MDRSERRILDAAAVVFGRYGYRQASVGQVADEAQLTRQSLYRYFENKEALFLAALRDLHDTALARAVEAGARARADGLDLAACLAAPIVAWLDLYIERLDVSPHADELLEESARQFGAVTIAHNQRLADLLTATIAAQMGPDPVASIVPSDLASLLMATMRGLKSARPRLSRDELERRIEDAARLLTAGAEALGYFR